MGVNTKEAIIATAFYAVNAWQHGKGLPTLMPNYDPAKEGTLDDSMSCLVGLLRTDTDVRYGSVINLSYAQFMRLWKAES